MTSRVFLAFTFLIGCGGSAKQADPKPHPPAVAPVCGWQNGAAPSCEADTDCSENSKCTTGQGNVIEHERDDGVTPTGPWEREEVKFCEPRACPDPVEPDAPQVEPGEPGPEPQPEPGG